MTQTYRKVGLSYIAPKRTTTQPETSTTEAAAGWFTTKNHEENKFLANHIIQ